jgi:hypothetical protein
MARGKKVSNKQKASAARKKLQAAFEAAAAAAETKKHATKRKKSPDNITSEVEAAEDTNAKRIRRSDFSSMTPPSSDSNPSRKGKKTRAKNSDAIIDASLLEDLSAEDSKVDAEGHMDIDGKDGNADDEHVLDTTSEGAGDVSGGAGELDGVAGDAEAVTHASKSSKKSRMARNFFAPVVAGMQQATQLAQCKALLPAMAASLSGADAALYAPFLARLGISMGSADAEDEDQDEDEDGGDDGKEDGGDDEEDLAAVMATFSDDDDRRMAVDGDTSPAEKSYKRNNKKSRLDSDDDSSDDDLDLVTTLTTPAVTSTPAFINIRNNTKTPSLPVLTQAACTTFIDDLRRYRVDFPHSEIMQFMPQLVQDKLNFFAKNDGHWPKEWVQGTPEQLQEKIMQAIISMRLDTSVQATGTAGHDLGGQLQAVRFNFDGSSMDPVFQFQQRLKTIMVSHADAWHRSSDSQRRNLLKEFLKTTFTGQGVIAHKHPVYYMGQVVRDRVESKKDIENFEQVADLLLRKCMKLIANNNNLATKGMVAVPIATWEKCLALLAASQTKQSHQQGNGVKLSHGDTKGSGGSRPGKASRDDASGTRTIGFSSAGYPHLRCYNERVLEEDLALINTAAKACPNGECYTCGRKHGGNCRNATSPHANTDSSIRWIYSAPAKLLHLSSKKLVREIPSRSSDGSGTSTSNNNTNQAEQPKQGTQTNNKKGKDVALCTTYPIIHNQSYLIDATLSGRQQNSLKTVKALLDSGAIGGSYVSAEVFSWLKSQSVPFDHCSQPLICSAFINKCFKCHASVKSLKISLSNSNDELIEFKTNVDVIDSPFDLIIGLPQIRNYDLTLKLRDHFTISEPSASNIDQVHSMSSVSVLSTLLASAQLAIEKQDILSTIWINASVSRELVYVKDSDEVVSLPLCGLNSITAARNNVKVVYQKHELLEQLDDSDEQPEWKSDITDFLPDDKSPKLQSNVPLIVGDTEFHERLRQLMDDYHDVFSRTVSAEPAQVPPMVLELNEFLWKVPANRGPPRPQTPVKQTVLLDMLRKMLENGIIQPSQASEYSQVLLVKKPHQPGAWRFCVDYRRLNEILQAMGWPIPNIERLFVRLGEKKAKFFAVLDLTSGYHQVLLDTATRKFAAFITDYGVFEPVRLWMGLKTAPSYFQQQMASILEGLLYVICELYLDDIIISGSSEDDFIHNLRLVFQRLRERKVTLNPDKAKIGLSELEYVGRVINQHGQKMSTEKISKVLDFPLPKTGKNMKQFIGLVNYFRSHVKGFAHISYPLERKILAYDQMKHRRLVYSEEDIAAFEAMKAEIANCHMLYFMNDTAPVFVATDASDYGIGAYLYQLEFDNESGEEHQLPVAFFSKTLSKVQQRWSTIEKECYAIWYALKHWEHLLRDVKFTIKTDHRNLRYLNTNTPKVVRWKLAIQEYDFVLEHIAGPLNIFPDTLSRLCQSDDDESDSLVSEAINLAALCRCQGQESSASCGGCATTLAALHDIVIPSDKYELINMIHCTKLGHFGVDITLHKLRQQGLTWPLMRQHVQQFIRQCPLCQKLSAIKIAIKTKPFTTAALEPQEKLNIDSLGPLPESRGFIFILVVICCFTRFVELYPLRSTEGEEAARHLATHAGRYGTPSQIVNDGGSQFVNETVETLKVLLDTANIQTLPYSKEENAIVERINKEVMRHLRAFVFDERILGNWSDYLPMVQRIINSTPHSSIGCSPAELLFGNAVTLDRNLYHNLPSSMDSSSKRISTTMKTWVDKMLSAQEALIDIARTLQSKKDAKHLASKEGVEEGFTEFEIDSFVLARYPETAMGKRPPTKLHTMWRGPYRVVNRQGSAYALQDMHTLKTFNVHVSLLKKYIQGSKKTDPQATALADKQFFIVEKILTHFGDIKHKSALTFLVKWEGSDETTREPWSHLKSNVKLHEYLASKPKLRSLIPTEFQAHYSNQDVQQEHSDMVITTARESRKRSREDI